MSTGTTAPATIARTKIVSNNKYPSVTISTANLARALRISNEDKLR